MRQRKATQEPGETARIASKLPPRYRRAWLAIARHLPPTPQVKDAARVLFELAPHLRPTTFCEYRRAITLLLGSRPAFAAKIQAIRQRDCVPPGWRPPRKSRKRTVLDQEITSLVDAASSRGDIALASALTLVSRFGMRAAELPNLSIKTQGDDGYLVITSAKRTAIRGSDRLVKLVPVDIAEVTALVAAVQGQNIRAMQVALYRLDRDIHPRRKQRVTFHRIRHQLASDAKAGGVDLLDLAALLGHRSTRSTRSYGNTRRGKPRSSIPTAVPEVPPREVPLPSRQRVPGSSFRPK